MPTPLRFIHTADLHLGVDAIGPIDPDTQMNGRVMDYLDTLDSIIDFAEQERVHLALFSGDAFHRSIPNPAYVNAFGQRITRLKQLCPVVLLVGNHDMMKTDRSSMLQAFSTLKVDRVVVGDRPNLHIVKTQGGDVQVGTVPYPTRHGIHAERHPGVSAKELIQAKTSRIINKMAEQLDDSMPAILMGHFTVSGCLFGAERGFADLEESEVNSADVLDPVWDYVALGHIHAFQDLRDALAESGEDPEIVKACPPVVYSGSVERVSFNEEHDKKGFVLGEVVPGHAEYEFIEVDARPYKTLEIVIDSDNPTSQVLNLIRRSKLTQHVVRVVIKIEDDMVHSLNVPRIQQALDNTGMYCLSSFNVVPIRHNAERAHSKDFNITMPRDDLLRKYFKLYHIKPENLGPVMKLAKEIMHEADNDQNT